ncbi:LysR substrate-binding domain-containing protein [Microvirga sp. G4-2]|uniref:LysR substrate-binding domain-containing protein n=1 Tax=Microvirga sp. G4-2 TaxID=3434467 RepID=UPI004043ACBA
MPTKNGVKLTAKGQALAHALTSLDHSLFALSNDLRAENKEAEGIVRVSITNGLNTFFVAPAVSGFAAEHSKIQLHLKSPANVVSLRDSQTDMMIGFSPIEASDIFVQKLGHLHFIPIVAKSYIRQHGIPTRSNLNQHYFLQSEFYMARTGLWDSWNQAVSQGQIAHFCDN